MEKDVINLMLSSNIFIRCNERLVAVAPNYSGIDVSDESLII